MTDVTGAFGDCGRGESLDFAHMCVLSCSVKQSSQGGLSEPFHFQEHNYKISQATVPTRFIITQM